jgi:hypothetical protein
MEYPDTCLIGHWCDYLGRSRSVRGIPADLTREVSQSSYRNDAASLVVVSVLYGIASGACEWMFSWTADTVDEHPIGFSLTIAGLASLAASPAEIG